MQHRYRAQPSPGALAEVHKSLEGLKNCLKCHQLGAGPSAEKCLACHKEINAGIRAERGYHHRVVTGERRACFECHGEHAGREFEMIHWPEGKENFEHEKTGLPLEGKHKKAKCQKCHQLKFIKDDPRTQRKEVNMEKTFLGLRRECMGCHFDEHRKQLSEDCVQCHDYEAWNPQPRFDHDKTRYRLTGKHSDVKCRKCHAVVKNQPLPEKPDDRSFVTYGGLQFENCTPCHKDIHKGKFENNCNKCHKTTSWNEVNEAEFDHKVTRFPLLGVIFFTAEFIECRRAAFVIGPFGPSPPA